RHRREIAVAPGYQVAAAAPARFRQVGLDETGHLVVAGTAGLAAHDDGDKQAAVALYRGNQVETGGPRVAGLDAVDALDAAEQAVVTVDAALAVFEGTHGKIIIILRKVLAQRD